MQALVGNRDENGGKKWEKKRIDARQTEVRRERNGQDEMVRGYRHTYITWMAAMTQDGKGRERMKLPRMRVRANQVDRKNDGGGNGWPSER